MGKNIGHDIAMVELRGSSISYFTGKMENYFRLKGIPYHWKAWFSPGKSSEIRRSSAFLKCQLSSYLMAAG